MKKIEIKANAKINLFLDISALRKDGYHDILSIMQSVSLCDTVNIEYEESSQKKIEVKCDAQSLPADSRNLAYKAADRLLDSGTVKIEIKKNIFLSAGLAGGSADAAAVLVGLARLSVGMSSESFHSRKTQGSGDGTFINEIVYIQQYSRNSGNFTPEIFFHTGRALYCGDRRTRGVGKDHTCE